MKQTEINKDHLKTYQSIKQKYPDAVLLFRLGDDYAAFNEDAEIVNALTFKGLSNSPGIGTVCRFPFADSDSILNTLVKAGHRVTLCDQLENKIS